jgi:hypothetical protein
MAIVVKHVTFGTKGTYPIVFSSNALYKLEEKTGMSTERIGLMLFTRRAGFQMMQIILWAALEAARVREKLRRDQFTIDEVGDLLDEEGGSAVVWAGEDDGLEEQEKDGEKISVQVREPRPLHPICSVVLECWTAAFPKPREVRETANPPLASADAQPGTSS